MASKKKKGAKRAPKKRKAASRNAAPRKAAKRKPAKRKAPVVARGKQGALKIAVMRAGAGFIGRITGPAGGQLVGASGSTPAEALRATKVMLGARRAGAGSLREARMRALCAEYGRR